MNHDEQIPDLEDRLRRLRPAAAAINPETVFFQAGYRAHQAECHPRRATPLVAAGFLIASLAVPAGYFAGYRAADDPPASVSVASTNEVTPETQQTLYQDDEPGRVFMVSSRIGPMPNTSEPWSNTPRVLAAYDISFASMQLASNEWFAFSSSSRPIDSLRDEPAEQSPNLFAGALRLRNQMLEELP